VFKKEKGLLESQERDGWTMLKMSGRKGGFKGWRKIARDRDSWKLILKEAKVMHGPYSQWGSTTGKLSECVTPEMTLIL
jgi:hypothetical protein